MFSLNQNIAPPQWTLDVFKNVLRTSFGRYGCLRNVIFSHLWYLSIARFKEEVQIILSYTHKIGYPANMRRDVFYTLLMSQKRLRNVTYKGGSSHKNWCMAKVLGFLIRYFSNYYTLHRSDLAARAAPLDPRLTYLSCKDVRYCVRWDLFICFWIYQRYIYQRYITPSYSLVII